MKTIIHMNSRKILLENEIKKLENTVNKYPEGSLIYHRNGNGYKFLKQIQLGPGERKRIYIPKSDQNLIKLLAMKAYHTRQLQDMKNEFLAVTRYLNARKEPRSSDFLDSSLPYFMYLPQELTEWETQPYDKSQKHPERLIVKAPNGLYVRSKSEAMIAYILNDLKIPFRYECALTLDGIKIYPDFTILHPTKRKEFIWEHFGFIDNLSYRGKTLSKLHLYMSKGYIPGQNFITTYETQNMPLDINYVENLVRFHFL